MLQLICLLHAVHNLAKRIHAAGMSGGGVTFVRSSLVQGTYTVICFRLNLEAAENNASISEEGKVVRQQAKNSYRRSAGAVSNVSLNGLQDALPFHQHQEYHWPQRRPALIEKKEREKKKHKDAV